MQRLSPCPLINTAICVIACIGSLAQAQDETEHLFWKSVNCSVEAEVRAYISSYPEGAYLDEALQCIADIKNRTRQRSSVDEQLRLCQSHLDANRLTTGEGGNAFDCYQSVLTVDPGNAAAAEGLRKIQDIYALWARSAIEDNNPDRAEGYMERLAQLNAGHPKLAELRKDVKQLKSGQERQVRYRPQATSDITVASWGGGYASSQKKALGGPWEILTKQDITWKDYDGGLDEIRKQVNSGQVQWDVVDVLPNEAIEGCEQQLFRKLPLGQFPPASDGTPMLDDLIVPPVTDCGAPAIFWAYVIVYDKRRFSNRIPKSIGDFFDTGKFPGKRALHTWPHGIVEKALVADGIAPDRVYDTLGTSAGVDRAFRKLELIREDVVFWSKGSEPLEMIKTRKVVMATAYDGRVSQAILEQNEPLVAIRDGQVLEQEFLVIVNGTQNYDSAVDFLKFASAPRQQAGLSKYIAYGPMRRSALNIISENEPFFHNGKDVMPHIGSNQKFLRRSIIADPAWWRTNGSGIVQRYQRWMQ